MSNLPKITKEEYLDTIREGIKDAILEMTESGDGYSGLIRTDQFFEAIKEGVAMAIWKVATNATSMPCADFYDSIKAGVEKAMEFKEFTGLQ